MAVLIGGEALTGRGVEREGGGGVAYRILQMSFSRSSHLIGRIVFKRVTKY